ncbi:MAG: sigma-54-dependent Fis family transcriptional regulator [Flavipsychrobacter sp.]|nr:sigma-54-dependent Fis family transcriptional regulator [Flavipsychrobacter sp.]
MSRILIVEDDSTFSQILENFLKRQGYEIFTAATVRAARQIMDSEDLHLLLLDYRLPDGTGIDLLDYQRASGTPLPSVVMTSFQDIKTAVRSVKSGAHDYIVKPVHPDELLMVVRELLNTDAGAAPAPGKKAEMVTGISMAARQVREHIELVGPTNMSVIVEGESGTGKEQVARTIHDLSKRAGGPFVAIDCGAIAADLASSELFGHVKGAFTGALLNKKGQFELAHGGTLFLDEIGNLGYEVQVKLLRALQEREVQPLGSGKTVKVDVRVLAATNDDLLTSVRKGAFREDLYHRLNEFKIKLPALRQREDDLNLFIGHFMAQSNKELGKNVDGVSPEVLALFRRYDWPGNLRELKNVVKRAVLLAQGSLITKEDIPAEMVFEIEQGSAVPPASLKEKQAGNERELIMKALEDSRYNKSKAARLLNIDRTTLYYKMMKYNIEK